MFIVSHKHLSAMVNTEQNASLGLARASSTALVANVCCIAAAPQAMPQICSDTDSD